MGLGVCVWVVCRRDCRRSNSDVRHKIPNQLINFDVLYEIDKQEAAHAISLNNYHKGGTVVANYQYWILLKDVKERN